MKVLYDPYISYGSLIKSLASRENSEIMKNEHSSQSNDYDWTGTHNYDEAVQLLSSGYMEVVRSMKRNVEDQTKINSKYYADVNHAVPHNSIVGYIPNVPNALRGIPQSMITIEKKPMKRKTLSIIYGVSGSASRDRDYFENAGTALLSAVDIIERCGIQTKIELAFFLSEKNDEFPLPTVIIKNYGERFSIQKVSFPLVHTSMFRRIGFKWLETTPMITEKDFAWGYGTPPSHEDSEKAVEQVLKGKGIFISNDWINNHNCDVNEILVKLGVV